MPSKLISINTIKTLIDSFSSPKKPKADSYERVNKMINCTIAGKGRRRAGKAGSPRDIEDRDKNTVAWYTS